MFEAADGLRPHPVVGHPLPAGEELTEAAAVDAKVLEAATKDSEIIANLTHLSDTIGPRLTGSAALKRANEWAADKMRSYGLTNVRLEAWTIPMGWERGPATARILEPDNGRSLLIASMGWSPGTKGKYGTLADSFGLPKKIKDKDATMNWLKICGSKAGQDAFNPQKGSVPARTDSDKSLYKDYLAVALKEWQDPNTKIVGSLTHGVVANNAFSAEIDTALGALVTGGDTAKFTDAVKKAYDANK